LANQRFGYIAADAGTGHMWLGNSRQMKLTAWTNDLLAVRAGEEIFISSGGRALSLFGGDGAAYDIRFFPGYAVYGKKVGGISVKTTVFVPETLDARIMVIEYEAGNDGVLSFMLRPVMGEDERESRIACGYDRPSGVLTARNLMLGKDSPTLYVTAGELDATCFDLNRWRAGEEGDGAALTGPPCLAFEKRLARGGRAVIITGAVFGAALPDGMARLLDPDAALGLFEETVGYIRRKIVPVTVKTPDAALDRYLNGWALYQTMYARLLARASLYQCGGAYGFRDQLQDVLSLVNTDPGSAKEHILRAAGRQYAEGDVQHWWHADEARPGGGGHDQHGQNRLGRGVRTHYSDDYLWLAYAAAVYIDKTGDAAILDQRVNFIESEPLSPGVHDRYEQPAAGHAAPVYEHLCMCAELLMSRGTGAHGLPLMLGGDWNDGMNLVGAGGRGESVWLGWFASMTLDMLAGICRTRGDDDRADKYAVFSASIKKAAGEAWDGAWYLRGYYDDGGKLGSADSEYCQIDSIAQSFAVYAGAPEKQRTAAALDSAQARLVDRGTRVVRLFDPAFKRNEANPGYICAYPEGVRENGGQYTHAAVWLAGAMLTFGGGHRDMGYEILSMLLPEYHRRDSYLAEAYVLAADVYYNSRHKGRGGWSWYTGASGWYYRAAMEAMLGLDIKNGRLVITPNLPSDWSGYEAVWRVGAAEYAIKVIRGAARGVSLDGATAGSNGGIPLLDDGRRHEVICVC